MASPPKQTKAEKQTILVTGGAGFIGSHTLLVLLECTLGCQQKLVLLSCWRAAERSRGDARRAV